MVGTINANFPSNIFLKNVLLKLLYPSLRFSYSRNIVRQCGGLVKQHPPSHLAIGILRRVFDQLALAVVQPESIVDDGVQAGFQRDDLPGQLLMLGLSIDSDCPGPPSTGCYEIFTSHSRKFTAAPHEVSRFCFCGWWACKQTRSSAVFCEVGSFQGKFS